MYRECDECSRDMPVNELTCKDLVDMWGTYSTGGDITPPMMGDCVEGCRCRKGNVRHSNGSCVRRETCFPEGKRNNHHIPYTNRYCLSPDTEIKL